MSYDIPSDHSTGPTTCTVHRCGADTNGLCIIARQPIAACHEAFNSSQSSTPGSKTHESPKEEGKAKVEVLKFDPSFMEKAAAYMERNMEAMVRYQRSYAQLQHERYRALISVGFTDQQAIEIICRTSLFGA